MCANAGRCYRVAGGISAPGSHTGGRDLSSHFLRRQRRLMPCSAEDPYPVPSPISIPRLDQLDRTLAMPNLREPLKSADERGLHPPSVHPDALACVAAAGCLGGVSASMNATPSGTTGRASPTLSVAAPHCTATTQVIGAGSFTNRSSSRILDAGLLGDCRPRGSWHAVRRDPQAEVRTQCSSSGAGIGAPR